jgi:hypothetical protein
MIYSPLGLITKRRAMIHPFDEKIFRLDTQPRKCSINDVKQLLISGAIATDTMVLTADGLPYRADTVVAANSTAEFPPVKFPATSVHSRIQ